MHIECIKLKNETKIQDPRAQPPRRGGESISRSQGESSYNAHPGPKPPCNHRITSKLWWSLWYITQYQMHVGYHHMPQFQENRLKYLSKSFVTRAYHNQPESPKLCDELSPHATTWNMNTRSFRCLHIISSILPLPFKRCGVSIM